MHTSTRPDVVVIGGGLAGGFTAHAFASRGATVTLLESARTLASKASGNRFALLTPYITTKTSALASLYSAGFRCTSSIIIGSGRLGPLLHRSGALQLPSTARLQAVLASTSALLGSTTVRRVSPHEASQLAGIQISSGAFYIAEAGFLEPARAIEQLLEEHRSAIKVQYDANVVQLMRVGNDWSIYCEDGRSLSAPLVVVCNAYEAANLEICSWLPLEPVRGQTVSAPSSPSLASLRTVLSFGGYITPVVGGTHFIGAHYRHNDLNPNPSPEDTADILARCSEWLPEAQFESNTTLGARVCFRTSTIDRLPYVGALPNFSEMKRHASLYRSGSDLLARVPLTHHQGLFVHLGHGSRGLLSCPLGAEIIARVANNESLAELSDVASIVSPDRVPYRILVA